MWKRQMQLLFFGIIVVPFLTFFIWSNWLIKEFRLVKPYGESIQAAMKVAFDAPNLFWITYGSVVIGAVVTGVLMTLVYIFEDPIRKPFKHIRGTLMVSWYVLRRSCDETTIRNRLARLGEVQKRARESGRRINPLDVLNEKIVQVHLGRIPIPRKVEPLHLLVGGTTGSGKSNAIKQLVSDASARNDRLIICDPNGEYFSLFGKPDDVILNPFDARFPGWSIFNEVRTEYDVERFARSIIPDARSANDQEWHGYAQFLFRETMWQMWRDGHRSTKMLIHYLCSMTTEELGTYLENTAAIGLFDQGASKALSSTRFILTKYLSPHKHLSDGTFSIRNWLENSDANIYITWSEDMVDALRPLISAWFDLLINSVLSLPMPTKSPRPIWYFLDELASMERLSSLEDGLTKGRKFGARFVCGLQSTAQLDDIYGKEKSQTLRSCFRNSLYLNIPKSDPVTAEEFSRGIGEREYWRREVTRTSTRGGVNRQVARRDIKERVVLPSQIFDLPDNVGYLCLAANRPVSRIDLAPRDYPRRNVSFITKSKQVDLLDAIQIEA